MGVDLFLEATFLAGAFLAGALLEGDFCVFGLGFLEII